MKEQHKLFSSMFGDEGGSGSSGENSPGPRTVAIGAYSQPNVLHARMKEQKLSHGETVTANISPVRLEMNYDRITMYFCPIQTIEVTATMSEGDGGRLPDEATVDGLNVPGNFKPGLYTLKNVILTSNGVMQVKATTETLWEPLQ